MDDWDLISFALLWYSLRIPIKFFIPIIVIATYRMERYFDDSVVAVCYTAADTFWSAFYFIACITLFFVVPLLVLVLLYAAIAYKLLRRNTELHRPTAPSPLPTIVARRQQSQRKLQLPAGTEGTERVSSVTGTGTGTGSHQLSSGMRKHRKQVIFMLIAVVASFFVCLLPFRAFTLWVIAVPAEDIAALGIEGYYNILYFCRIMLYLNSALNPILYNLMSSKFRAGFWRLIVSCCGRTEHGLGRGARRATTTTTTTASRRQLEATLQSLEQRRRMLRREATFVVNSSSISISSGAERASSAARTRVSVSAAIIDITASTMTTACPLPSSETD